MRRITTGKPPCLATLALDRQLIPDRTRSVFHKLSAASTTAVLGKRLNTEKN